MGFYATAALGAAAGVTIFLGLPVARIGRPSRPRMAFLNSASVGVLLFILYDVLRSAGGSVEAALDGTRGRGIVYALLLAAGLATGLLGLVAFERLVPMRPALRPTPATAPGAVAGAVSSAPRMALLIASGIGLHNFSEGLAIGQSAAAGVYRLLWVLVIGFGLHNITEGFGITAPLIGQRPSWRFLGICGLIGGGPTFVGTLLGYVFNSSAVSIFCLALAAGAIMYVIGELQHAGRKIGSHDVAMVGLLAGFLAGFSTDLILHVAGA